MFMLKQQFYPEEILKRILDPDFVNKISDSNLYKLDRNYLDIDFCIELEYPEYNGPRLRKDVVNFLMKVKIGSFLFFIIIQMNNNFV